MSHADGVPLEFLQKVAGQLKDVLSQHLSSNMAPENADFMSSEMVTDALHRPEMRLTLCESFAVWQFKPGTIAALAKDGFAGDIFDWSEPTKSFYHQVRQGGKLVAFARSRVGETEGDVSLTQYNVSPMISAVDRAIEVIERGEHDDKVAASDPVVRLLEVPSHHVIALWLYAVSLKESRCVLVGAPQGTSKENQDRLLTSGEFFNLLKRSGLVHAIT